MAQAAPSRLTQLIVPAAGFLALATAGNHVSVFERLFAAIWSERAAAVLPGFVGTLTFLCAAWLCSRAIVLLILNRTIKRRTGSDAPSILANVIYATLFVITGFLIVKFVFGRPIGGLMATSGLVTLIIGFAIRDMIADFFSGLAMNIEQPYSIGDWLELEPNVVGRVTELNWRSTRLMTQSHRTIVVPNNNLAARQFINYSLPERRYRESLEITLNYTTDPDRVVNILTAAVTATKGLVDGAPHNVRIKEFTERGVVYDIRFWIDDLSQKVALRHKVACNTLRHLHQAGIPIPYAQHEIVMGRQRKPRRERRIDARRLLSRIELLEAMTSEELDQLAEVSIARNFQAGSTVFQQGDSGESLFLVVEGVAEAHSGDPHDGVTAVGQIQPGQAMGEMSVLTGAPRGASVTAKTDIFALEVRREDLEPIFRARPDIVNQLGIIMARRMRHNEQARANGANDGVDGDRATLAQQLASMISSFFGMGVAH